VPKKALLDGIFSDASTKPLTFCQQSIGTRRVICHKLQRARTEEVTSSQPECDVIVDPMFVIKKAFRVLCKAPVRTFKRS